MRTSTSWSSHCESLPGSSTAKTSMTLPAGKRHVRVPDAPAERLPVDLTDSGGVAVPDVVQVDLGSPAAAARCLNRRGDRVRVGGVPSSGALLRRALAPVTATALWPSPVSLRDHEGPVGAPA